MYGLAIHYRHRWICNVPKPATTHWLEIEGREDLKVDEANSSCSRAMSILVVVSDQKNDLEDVGTKEIPSRVKCIKEQTENI